MRWKVILILDILEIHLLQDIGGSLLNFNEVFPNEDCARRSLNFLDEFQGTGISQVILNRGPTQDQLGALLKSTSYFINAMKRNLPYTSYFEYATIVGSPLNIHQFLNPSEVSKDCLSVIPSRGQLQFQNADCGVGLTPLCFRISEVNVTAACKTCDSMGKVACFILFPLFKFVQSLIA